MAASSGGKGRGSLASWLRMPGAALMLSPGSSGTVIRAGLGVGSGTYIVLVEGSEERRTQKITLLK